jgi:GcrA cell cycle regulator
MSWTPELKESLRRLWSFPSMSTAEIGRRLGVSKNSVVGQAHRLGLPARESPIGRTGPRPVVVPVAKQVRGAAALAVARQRSLPPAGPQRAGGGGSVAALVGRAAASCPKVTLPHLGAPPPQDSRPVWKSTTSHYPAEMTCQFPTDTPPRGVLPTFCGATRHPGRPYCLVHCERAYTGFRAEAVAA